MDELSTGLGPDRNREFPTLAVFYMNTRWQKLLSMERGRGVGEEEKERRPDFLALKY